jgi:hypothetical protein
LVAETDGQTLTGGHIQAALPSLRESALRSEVTISSSHGILRLSGQPAYAMTKNALDYLPGRWSARGAR